MNKDWVPILTGLSGTALIGYGLHLSAIPRWAFCIVFGLVLFLGAMGALGSDK